ncbi:MAG: hypothetical protein ABIO91_02795 [Pyrinomonadaceae bacterium]
MNKRKNLNPLNLVLPAILCLTFMGTVHAQIDLFFGGPGIHLLKTNNPGSANIKNLSSKSPIQIKKTDAANCVGDTCLFFIYFNVQMANSEKRDISPRISLQVESGDQNTMQVRLLHYWISTWHILPIKLRVGTNKVKFTVDPDNKIAETSESNNTSTWTIFVEPTPIVIP